MDFYTTLMRFFNSEFERIPARVSTKRAGQLCSPRFILRLVKRVSPRAHLEKNGVEMFFLQRFKNFH